MILFIFTILLTGCSFISTSGDDSNTAFDNNLSEQVSQEQAQNDDDVLKEDIRFYPAFDENYKTGKNIIFDFWFDIPVEWNAVDNSDDGSTFDILSGNDNVSIQISGKLMDEDNKDEDRFYTALAGKNATVEDFRFRDGWVGKHIQASDNEAYYVRVDGDSYLIVHINTNKDPKWKAQNEEIINNIALSTRTMKESHGKHGIGEETIKREDLQLGDISVGMTYDELIDAMDQSPGDVVTEEYEGFAAKTLFFADGTQAYIVDDIVYIINVTCPDYATPRGLKIGDSKQRLEELYGKPSNESDGILGYTYNGYELFMVVIEDNKVSQIQIDFGAGEIEIY